MSMKNPPHPGVSVKINCLEPLGLNVTEGAIVLGVSRSTLSKVINGKSSISPEMAIRLSKAFGSSPGCWLRMQLEYDMAQLDTVADNIDIPRYAQTDENSPSVSF